MDTHASIPHTISLPALDLTPDHLLVGEAGNISAIYEVTPNSLLPGFVTVQTEFGPLLLDDDRAVTYPVLVPGALAVADA